MSTLPALAAAWSSAALDTYLRWYHRHEVHVDAPVPDEPVLFVSNHGFGGLVDLNVLAITRIRDVAQITRPTTSLVHQLAWTLGVGPLVEAVGGRPASKQAADDAFAADNHVLVSPGGDLDAGKSWRDRNRIQFDQRCGFARLAIEHGVPVVPIVTAGAGESALVISDGQRLARALRLPKLLRLKALPISLTAPWGLSIGVAGMLPYTAAPAKLSSAVLPAMTPQPGESAEDFAQRIQTAMQSRMDDLVADRIPVLG